MDISLTVIVKNDAVNLSKCLQSAKSVAGEIIVVDTGSSDDSIMVARSHGAKVFEMPWQDDFSIARNYALTQTSKKWILQLDADEELDPSGIDEIRKLLSSSVDDHISSDDRTSGSNTGLADIYAFRVVDLASSEIYYLNRLFLRGNYIYEGKIHERLVRVDGINNSEKGSSVDTDDIAAKTNISIIHKGYLAENINKFEKIERNLRMLTEMHKDDPNDQMTNFYLGATHQSAGNNEEAARYYRFVISSQQNLHFPNAYKNLMRVYEASKDLPRAIVVAHEGLAIFPQYTTLRFHLGIAKYLSGDLSGAAEAFRQCLRSFSPINGKTDTGIVNSVKHANKDRLSQEHDSTTVDSAFSAASNSDNKVANFTEVPGIELLSRVFLGLADFEISKDASLLKTLDQLMLSLSNDPDALFYLGKTFINAYGIQGAEEQFKKLANLKDPRVKKCFELLFGRNAT